MTRQVPIVLLLLFIEKGNRLLLREGGRDGGHAEKSTVIPGDLSYLICIQKRGKITRCPPPHIDDGIEEQSRRRHQGGTLLLLLNFEHT